MNKRFWSGLALIVWITSFVILGLTFYVNWYLPHGPFYPTGEYVSRYEGGPMVEEYKEDLRELNIPNWAKLLRNDNGFFLWMVLVIAGLIISNEAKKQSNP